MRRYQVRPDALDWADDGPDLYHQRAGATRVAMAEIDWAKTYWGRRRHSAEWREIGRRRAVKTWLDQLLPTMRSGDVAQIERRRDHEPRRKMIVAIRALEVYVPELAGANPATETANALYDAAFPASTYAGSFVCKRFNGSSDPRVGFSDHAWGDALDRGDGGVAGLNDRQTDWGARMASAGEIPAAQILGSRAGQVVEARARLIGGWRLLASGASTSHLHHVHHGVREHRGATPPCAS